MSWLTEINPTAALPQLQRISTSGNAGLTAAAITPLAIDGLLTSKSGEGLIALAEERVKGRPQPGELGYTARYVPPLWLIDDGDDIAHYHDYQAQALRGHQDAINGVLPDRLLDPARVDPKIVAVLGRQYGIAPKRGGVGHNRPPPSMTSDPAAARAAQLLGQAISPLSTSSILEVLRGRK